MARFYNLLRLSNIWAALFRMMLAKTRTCATCWTALWHLMHYAMRDVKDMGQQMGYHSLEWNWQKEAMSHEQTYLGRKC